MELPALPDAGAACRRAGSGQPGAAEAVGVGAEDRRTDRASDRLHVCRRRGAGRGRRRRDRAPVRAAAV